MSPGNHFSSLDIMKKDEMEKYIQNLSLEKKEILIL